MYKSNHINSGHRKLEAVIGEYLVVRSDSNEQPLLVIDGSGNPVQRFQYNDIDDLSIEYNKELVVIYSHEIPFEPHIITASEQWRLPHKEGQLYAGLLKVDEYYFFDEELDEYYAINRDGHEMWRIPSSELFQYGRFIYNNGVSFKDAVQKDDDFRTEIISRLASDSFDGLWSYQIPNNHVLITSNGKSKFIQIADGRAYFHTSALDGKNENHVICLDVETGATIWHRTRGVLSGYSLDPITGNLVLCTGKAFHTLDGKTGETLVLRNLTIEDSYVDLSIATEDQQIHDGKLFYIGRRNDIENEAGFRNVAEYGVIDPLTGDKLWFDNFETEYQFGGELFVSGPRVYFSIPGDGYRVFEKQES